MMMLGRSALIYLAIATAVLVVVAALYGAGYRAGANARQAEWDVERLATAAAVRQQIASARQAEHQASQSIANLRERTDATITDLNRRHARALDRVRLEAGAGGRDLPNRTAAESPDCAGAGVPDRDGVVVVADQQADQRWLLDLARDADITRLALQSCREQYETVRAMQ